MNVASAELNRSGCFETDLRHVQQIDPQFLGFPYEIMLKIFAEFKLSFRDLEACALTCKSWKIAAEEEGVGAGVLIRFPFPIPRAGENWMKAFRYWVHHANMYFLIDRSNSKALINTGGSSVYEEAIAQFRDDVQACLPFASKAVMGLSFPQGRQHAFLNHRLRTGGGFRIGSRISAVP